jgi:predicted RND superfamily exporter protein
VSWIYDHRWACLASCLALTLLAALPAAQVGTDNRVQIWFVEDDPALVAYESFLDRFGNDEVVVIAFHRPEGIITAEGLALVQEATRRIEGVEGVDGVLSLARLPDVWAEKGELQAKLLVPQGPLTAEEATQLRRRLTTDPGLGADLVSTDGTTTVVMAQMVTSEDIDLERELILNRLNEALEGLSPAPAVSGLGVFHVVISQLSLEDSRTLVSISYLLIVLLLWFFTRRLVPVLVILGVVTVSMVWLMGLYGLAGRDINMVTMVMPTLVLIIAVADCLHILMHVARQPAGRSRRDRVVQGVSYMLRPCLFNTLTTAAGFAALATGSIQIVRDLGIFSALGLVGAFAAAIVGCTWALAWEAAEPRLSRRPWLDRLVLGLAHVGTGRPATVLSLTLVVGVMAGWGLSRLVADTYSAGFLREGHQLRQETDFIEQRFGPVLPLEFVVESNQGVTRPELFHAIHTWQQAAEAGADVGWSRSVVDIVGRMEGLLQGDGSRQAAGLIRTIVPTTIEEIDSHLRSLRRSGSVDPATLMDGTEALRVTFGIYGQSGREFGQQIEKLLALADMPEGVTITPGGYLPLYVQMTSQLVASQVSSLSVALIVIFCLIALAFRSWRLALLSLVPNVAPVALVLGFMGWAGIRLDIATVTIGAILLGIVVDDTVHFLHRLSHEWGRADSPRQAVEQAVQGVGRPMVSTTAVFALGFCVLIFAQVTSVMHFGLLIALGLIFALVADLIVLPALVVLWQPKLARYRKHLVAPRAQG